MLYLSAHFPMDEVNMVVGTPTQHGAAFTGPAVTERLGYTVNEMARACGLHPDTVRDHCKSGKLPAVRIGWQFIIPAAAIKRMFPEAKL